MTSQSKMYRAVMRERAQRNPQFWDAICQDARAAARSMSGETAQTKSWAGLWLVIRMIWAADGFFPLFLARLATYLRGLGIPGLPMILRRLAIVTGQVHIGAPVILQPGLVLPHGQVVIDGLVEIGPGAIIRPFVTIGLAEGNIIGPTIGSRVRIGTGAKVIGPITIGKDVKIGANAVVNCDVPDGATVIGVPGRVISKAATEPPRDG